MPQATEPRRRRGIYLLPNLVTTASLFSGFLSIVFAVGGQYAHAAMAILMCVLLDNLDGRIARMTRTESDFGMHYDSLVDVICFGLAPALLVHQFLLREFSKLGWLTAFLFVAAATLRLARFNAQVGSADKRYFQGLPCPAAAALLVCFIWLATRQGLPGYSLAVVVFTLTLGSAALMVSTFRYYSLKSFDFAGRVRFLTVAAIALTLALIALDPPLVLFLLTLAYTFSGVLLTLNEKRRRRRRKRGHRESLPTVQTVQGLTGDTTTDADFSEDTTDSFGNKGKTD